MKIKVPMWVREALEEYRDPSTVITLLVMNHKMAEIKEKIRQLEAEDE
ncbi:hypothetical protein [Pseudodesulfovibrio sediminis]|nr:hypothetical protein [Pseudodesulfovibrio sediminis]